MKLNINTNKIVAHTNRLERLNRYALPVVIRGTLNDAAYDVKTDTMPLSAKKNFEQRQKNFFKANSKYIKADGLNINTMESHVGFYENKLHNRSTNWAVKDLNEQEEGGIIKKKSFIPLPQSRKGGIVTSKARLSAIKRIINRSNVKGNNWAQQMIKSALFSGIGGFLLTDQSHKGGALFKIKSIKRIGRNTRFIAEKLYSFKKNRSVQVNSTYFMKNASLDSAYKMDEFYINRAIKQYTKAGILKK